MKKEILTKILSACKMRKTEAEYRATAIYNNALNNATFKELDLKCRGIAIDLARAEMDGKDFAKMKIELSSLTSKRRDALSTIGLKEKDLLPRYTCPICNDTGYNKGVLCECVKRDMYKHLKEVCGISKLVDFRFSDCNLDVFKNSLQEKAMISLYKTMRAFAEKFPDTKHLNLVFSGASGVGKSCLVSAIACELMERGFYVLSLTAFDFNNIMLRYHTTSLNERSEYMDNLLMCDMLIIDDLGTEPILNNVTIEYLFSVLSERIKCGKHTAFSTNLALRDIVNRYGERIASRLYDKEITLAKHINGDDLRLFAKSVK